MPISSHLSLAICLNLAAIMPQSTIICIDNSENTRNGDFYPSRLQAQQETVNEIVRGQLRTSLENDVALLAMAGTRPEVLVPLSRSQVALQRKLYSVQSGGIVDPLTSIRVAQLILKHRQGIQHAQRVMVFIGSPVTKDTLKAANRMGPLGQSLRKANVSVDIVVFGTAEETQHTSELFKPFLDVLGDHCQLLTVTSQYSLIDVVFGQVNSLSGSVQAGGPSAMANEDPELAMAIQMSLQGMKKDEGISSAAVTNASTEDADLLLATQMSLQDGKQSTATPTAATSKFAPPLAKQSQMGKTGMNPFKSKSEYRPSQLSKNNPRASAKGALKQDSKSQANTPRASPLKAKSTSSVSSSSRLSLPSNHSTSGTLSLSSEEASLLQKILSSKYYQQLKAKRQRSSLKIKQPPVFNPSKTQSVSKTSSGSLSNSKGSNLAQLGKSPTSNKTSQTKLDAKSSETKVKTSLISKKIEEMIIASKAKLNSDSQKVMSYPGGSSQPELTTQKDASSLKEHSPNSAVQKDGIQTVQAKSEQNVPGHCTNLSKQADLTKSTGTDSSQEISSSSSYSLSSHKRATSSIKGTKSASFKSKVTDSTQICYKANSKVAPAEPKLNKCKTTKPSDKHS